MTLRQTLAAFAAAALLAGPALADATDSLKKGNPDMKSAGALAFGPDGVLFVGDSMGAAVIALDTGDRTAGTPAAGIKAEKIDHKIAAMLGTTPDQITLNDLAVNPISGAAYISVSRGKGPDAPPAIVRIDAKGETKEVAIKDVKFAKATLPNVPAADAKDRRGQPLRVTAITDLAFSKGRVFVAGMSNEEFASKLRAIPFPFTEADKGTSVEIYHGAHGAFETRSPVRTFAPFEIKGEAHLLAAYQCTPLVKFPVEKLKAGEKYQGTTIAELGSGNAPLDMIVYQKDGKDYILLTNTRHGMMKITTEGIDTVTPIKEPVRGGGTAGLKFEKIADLAGVLQMDRLDKEHALVMLQNAAKDGLDLKTIKLP